MAPRIAPSPCQTSDLPSGRGEGGVCQGNVEGVVLPRFPVALPPTRPQGDPSRGLFGALDLGTNNCRLLIARMNRGDDLHVVDSFSKITRLGEGLQTTGALGENAMDRTLVALKVCSERLKRRNMSALRCVATAACRMASNADAFLDRVRSETGLPLEIISAAEEARLTLAGCLPLLAQSAPVALLFDIGGGSTELMVAEIISTETGPVPGRILAMDSLPFGVVTLAEAVGGGHLSARLHTDIVAHVTRHLSAFDPFSTLGDLARRGGLTVLGASGTVTTAGAIVLDLPRYDRTRVDGMTLSVPRLKTVGERLLSMTVQERIGHPCIGRDRADLVLSGSAILEAILSFWPVAEIRIADRGVREGLLFDLMTPTSPVTPARPVAGPASLAGSTPCFVGERLDVAS